MASAAAKLVTTPKVFQQMTEEQHASLVTNVLAEGIWEDQDEFDLWMEFGTLMVRVTNAGKTTILLGIEKDGYCHS